MFKFILLLSVMTLSVSTNAQVRGIPKANSLLEETLDENSNRASYFYKKTRLECVRMAIKNTTGIDPSTKYLAAVALKVRNSVTLNGRVKEKLDTLNEDENGYQYRFLYLSNVAHYISTYGFCKFKENEKDEAVEPFTPDETKQVADFIETSVSSFTVKKSPEESLTIDNASVTRMISGQDKYNFINQLFNSEIEGVPQKFRSLPKHKKRDLAKDGIAYAKDQLNTVIPFKSTNSFSKCVSSLEEYHKDDGFTKNNGEKVSSKNLCKAIMTSCGYEGEENCKDEGFETKSAPKQKTRPSYDTEVPSGNR